MGRSDAGAARRARAWRMRGAAAVVIAAASLGLAACGDDDDAGGAAAAGTGTQAAETTASSGASSQVEQSSIDVAATYAGVTPGKADMSLEPLKIGFTTQEGGTPAYPEHSAAAKATVKFINEHLGGVQGHPLELDTCIILSEEDGQKCAGQLLNDGVMIGNHGLSVVGQGPYFKTVKGKFPIIVSGQGGGPDVTTKDVYLLDAGGGVGTIGGMVEVAKSLGAKKIAFISSDNPAAKYAYEQLFQPALKKNGVTAKTVFVPDTGTTPDYASALQAAGAQSADVVMVLFAGAANCVSLYDAMKQLGIEKKVVSSYVCYGDPFPEHAGDALENWYFSGPVVNPRIGDDPQAVTYRNVMTAYGNTDLMFSGYGAKEFQDLLLITKWATEIGFDNLTPDALNDKIKAYEGPGFLVAGTLKCDGDILGEIGVCGEVGGKSTFRDGKFVAFEEGMS